MDNSNLSICLPALNEGSSIEKYVRDIYVAAKEHLTKFEIIIVDDGSTDDTYEIATQLQKKLGDEVKVIRKEKNEGIGPALRTASEHAQYAYFVGFPSDGAYLIEGVKKLFMHIGEKPIIISYRENLNQRPMLRKVISKCVTYYVRFLCGKKIKDSQSAIVIPTELYRSLKINFAKYNCQMQIVSLVLSYRIEYREIPVIYSSDADQQSGMIRWNVLKEVLKTSCHLLYLKCIGKLGNR